jgi:hypothetical protein
VRIFRADAVASIGCRMVYRLAGFDLISLDPAPALLRRRLKRPCASSNFSRAGPSPPDAS